MVINNCLNAGNVNQERDNSWFTEYSTFGGIIGRGRDNTKVTNCLSTTKYPICGARSVAESKRLDKTSGNNYSVGLSDYDSDMDFHEMTVSQDLLDNGLVALWLNNDIENRAKGIKPWHQNLWARHSNGVRIPRDNFPSFAESHDEVNAELFYDNNSDDSEHVYIIRTAEQLQRFASDVNSGKQFLIGYLDKDIDMNGQTWTAIGKDEANKHFRGIFDGRGHKISGLTCSSSDKPVGLFGAVHVGANIRNVTIGEGSMFSCSGNAGAGGIVGTVHIGWKWGNVAIENCISHADINVNKFGGGILGRVSTGDDNDNVKVFVNNCFSTGTVTANDGTSALLCGDMKHTGVISNCWSSGQLRIGQSHSTWPYSIVNPNKEGEFLVGYDNKLDIKNCYIVDMEDCIDRYNEYPLQNGVTNLSASAVAIGELAHRFNQGCGSSVWQQGLGVDALPAFGTDGLYHARTISESANGYGTVCLPFALESNDDISYYSFSESTTVDDNIVFSFNYTDKVSAGMPALFRTSKTGEFTFRGVGD